MTKRVYDKIAEGLEEVWDHAQMEKHSQAETPEWIRAAQDSSGFWTAAEATETSPKFIREDRCIVVNGATIDRTARYLRETYRKGQVLNDWSTLPKSAKKKWIVLAIGIFGNLMGTTSISLPANDFRNEEVET